MCPKNPRPVTTAAALCLPAWRESAFPPLTPPLRRPRLRRLPPRHRQLRRHPAPAPEAARRGPPGPAAAGAADAVAPRMKPRKAQVAKLAELPAWKAGDGDGGLFLGPTCQRPGTDSRDGVPRRVLLTMDLADSKFYPPTGLAAAPRRPRARSSCLHSRPNTSLARPRPCSSPTTRWARMTDRRPRSLPALLDNMIADKRLPPMIAVMVMHGGGDGPGSERGLEYDTVSGKYAEFIEAEVLPRVAKDYNVTFTKDPEARATMGGSSGGAAALSMAWFHPELYHRVLVFSGTFVNQQRRPRRPPRRLGIPRKLHPQDHSPEQTAPPLLSRSGKTTMAPRPPAPACITG